MNWINQLNEYGQTRTPCLFILDFELNQPIIQPLHSVNPDRIQYRFREITNSEPSNDVNPEKISFQVTPPTFKTYQAAFEAVMTALRYGNSYLLNLTFASRIQTNHDLHKIYQLSRAPYRLWLQDRLVMFSPECFVRIENNQISTYPMKGTIDANLPNAESQLMANRKELAEHHTVVDLLRNDLNQVADDVTVVRFRYLEKIQTARKSLLQTSSEIRGRLPSDWAGNLGTMLAKLLPAGSISGAPKEKTVEIIKTAEPEPRGYYTGICGIFDGAGLDTAIMIRFIEQRPNGLWFHSGGGITVNSRLEDEYRELVDKVYLPFRVE